MRITPSARKHGISDEDMLHAARNPLRTVDMGEGTTLYIGAALNGALLEVVVAGMAEDDLRIIHAMPLREKFHHYL